jgi:hypothetical protein
VFLDLCGALFFADDDDDEVEAVFLPRLMAPPGTVGS